MDGSTARITANNTTSREFTLERGTRQGDPLSPSLFVLVMEALAKAILEDDTIKGLALTPATQDHKIKVLLFADDIVVLANSPEDAAKCDAHVRAFCRATGAKINENKTKVILPGLPNTPEDTNNALKALRKHGLSYDLIEHNKTEKYLGIQVSHKGVVASISDRVGSLCARLHNWPLKYISPMGKAALVSSYIFSTLNHVLYIDPITQDNVEAINTLEACAKSLILNGARNIKANRLQASRDKGGLKLPNLQYRFLCAKALLLERALHMKDSGIPAVGARAYIGAWVKEIQSLEEKRCKILAPEVLPEEARIPVSSRLLADCIAAWKEIQWITLSGHDKLTTNPKLSNIYTLLQNQIDSGTTLTKTQHEILKGKSDGERERIWKSILKGCIGTHKGTTWRLLQSLLPYKRSYPRDQCAVCRLKGDNNPGFEESMHIFFECPYIVACAKTLRSTWESLNPPKNANTKGAMWWSMDTLLSALIQGNSTTTNWLHAWIWVIWHTRNRAKWDNTLIPIPQMQQILRGQLERTRATMRSKLLASLMDRCTRATTADPSRYEDYQRVAAEQITEWEHKWNLIFESLPQ